MGLLVFHAKHSTRAKHRLLPSSSLPFPSSFQLKLPFHLPPTPPTNNYRVWISGVQCPQIISLSFDIFFLPLARYLIFGTRVRRGLDTHQHSLVWAVIIDSYHLHLSESYLCRLALKFLQYNHIFTRGTCTSSSTLWYEVPTEEMSIGMLT